MPGLPSCLIPAVVLLVTLATGSGMAAPAGGASGPAQQCAIATRRAELKLGLPSGLLQAIALTESGRWDGARHRSFAWPWTVTSGVDGAYLDSKAEALARIDALQRAGRDNIDVGCMQVNLHHHPDAFPSLEQALDPAENVAYGAAFLADLREATQSWDLAIERYHSSDPERGRAYRERVLENWRRIRPDPPAASSPTLAVASAVRPASRPATRRLQAASTQMTHPEAAVASQAAGRGVWHWLTPAGSFPIAAVERPRPLVFAGPREEGRRSLLPGVIRVASPPPG